jgi:hypothetical protein
MRCPGSVTLGNYKPRDHEIEEEFSRPGQVAHTLGEWCLSTGQEPWQLIGDEISPEEGPMTASEDTPGGAIIVDQEMANAVQEYLSAIDFHHPDRNQGNSWVERRFHCPDLHELFYGTSDFAYVDENDELLHIWDFKYGAGIVVEVANNPQLMYYAAGMLEDLQLWDTVDRVILHISQPRGFHADGTHRAWGISTEDLETWLIDTLIPAMNTAQVSRDTASGEHCRFCPARFRACPQILKDTEELAILMDKAVANDGAGAAELSAEQLGRLLDLGTVFKIANKAALKAGFARLQAGHEVPGYMLATARSNREWKEGAEKAAVKKFGKKRAFSEPALKSPAQIEKMPGGEEITILFAEKPDKGLTLAPITDGRRPVSKDTKSLFEPVKKKRRK